MKDLAIASDTGDLVLVDGDLQVVEGRAAVAQSANITLRLNRGEFFLDHRAGLDRDRTHGKGISPIIQEAEYRRAILSVPHLLEIVELSIAFDPATRTASPSFVARTDFDDAAEILTADIDPGAFPERDAVEITDGYYLDGDLVPVPDGYWVDGENTGEPDLAIYPRSAWFDTLPLTIETYEGEAE